MTTRLTDAVVPQVFSPYAFAETARQSEILRAGILKDDPFIAQKLKGGGATFNIPFWNELARTAANIANDNPASVATPGKITSGQQTALRQVRTQGWADADLVSELAGDDPMKTIASRVGKYWADEYQTILVSTLRGLTAQNVASNGGDMVRDISNDNVGAPAAVELFSPEALIDTKQTMGDAGKSLDTLVVHSVVKSRMQKQNLITFVRNSENDIGFEVYLGKYRIVEDDGCPAIAGTNRIRYHSYLTAKGVMGWADVPVDVPDETKREPGQGNGMGVEQLWSRRQFSLHPYGYKWLGASMAGPFPTNAELETAGNWQRIFPERKQIKVAVLVTNG